VRESANDGECIDGSSKGEGGGLLRNEARKVERYVVSVYDVGEFWTSGVSVKGKKKDD